MDACCGAEHEQYEVDIMSSLYQPDYSHIVMQKSSGARIDITKFNAVESNGTKIHTTLVDYEHGPSAFTRSMCNDANATASFTKIFIPRKPITITESKPAVTR